MPGVNTWTDPPFLLPTRGLWLDGQFIATAVGEGTPPFTVTPEESLFLRRAASGKGILSRPYVGTTLRPRLPAGFRISIDVGALDQQADWKVVELARQRGEAIDLCIGGRTVDSFDVQTSDVVTLTRRRAAGVVTGVDETGYSTKFWLDGSAGAHGTLTGQQQVTALGTGRLDVEYTPLHYIIFEPVVRSLAQMNDLGEAIEAVEVVTFG